MYPSIAHVMAQTHAEDLRREAKERHWAAQVSATPRPWATAWRSAISFVVTHTRAVAEKTSTTTSVQPACCPA